MRYVQLVFYTRVAAMLFAQSIAAGSAFERGLQKDAVDSYSIAVAQGQFLNVVVEQRALDVRLRLLAPDGSTLLTCDSNNGPFGLERIAYIAPAAGSYRVEVSTSATAPDGRYVLSVPALRAPTAADVQHVAAERAFLDAEALRPRITAESRPLAIAKYREAAAGFRHLGLKHELALALFSSGLQQLSGGETREALPGLAESLDIVRAAKEPFAATVLTAVGGAYDILGDSDRAMALYREALDTSRAVRNRTSEATSLNNIGKVYADRGDWQQSLAHYRLAVPAFHALGDARREGIALHNIGVAYQNVGDSERAISYLEQALERRRAAKDPAGEADTLTQLGGAHAALGDTPRALSYYEAALPLRQTVGDRRSESITVRYLARLYAQSGDPAKALASYTDALQLSRASADRRNEAAALVGRADALLSLKRTAEARDDARHATEIDRAISDRASTASALYMLARAERDLGDAPNALAHAEEAVRTVEEVRGLAASRLLRTSFVASRHDLSTFYIDLLMRQHRQDPSARGDLRALEASERSRARTLVELLAESGVDPRVGADPALVERERGISERLNVKSARLVNLLARGTRSAESDALAREVHDLETEFDEVQASLRKMSPAYATMVVPEPINVAMIQRDLLDDRTTVLEYSLGRDASYVWVIDRHRVRSVQLPPADEIDAAARAVYALASSHTDAKLPAALRRLSALILAPVLPLPENSRVVVVADGALQYVPFAMLPVGAAAEPLVVRAEVVNAPSLAAVAAQRALLSGRKPAKKTLAVIADPVFDASDPRVTGRSGAAAVAADTSSDRTRLLAHLPAADASARVVIPRLPFTATEASAIAATAGPTQTLVATGFEARKDAVLGSRLKEYRYVHFATHGFIDSDNPSLSAIALSLVDADGRPQDGFLRADELYSLDLSADLVVLSACQTGLGKSIEGEGLVGLTRGLMHAGAPRVVVSLWSVSDRATADLMSRFYREMIGGGRTPAAALRAAQIAMRQTARGRSPYYWAAFTLQGDWK